MKPAKLMFLAALLCLALSDGYPVNQVKDSSAEMALQAAIKTETIDGNLKSAIEQYQKIVEMSSASRAVKAQAMLQLGGCYEKLGSAVARDTFQQIVKEYADQTAIAAQASTRLAALAHPAGSNASNRGIVLRESAPSKFMAVLADPRISPDGKLFAFASITGSSLMVYDTENGKSTDLGVNKLCNGCSVRSQTWSPDGNQIAFFRPPNTAITPSIDVARSISELCIVDKDGTNLRVIYTDPDIVTNLSFSTSPIRIVGWSPDKKAIFICRVLKNEKVYSMDRISLPDGNRTNLRTFGKDAVRVSRLSPDGRFIVYELASAKDLNTIEIRMLTADGGHDESLAKVSTKDSILDWTPDSHNIFFSSNRSGNPGIWAFKMNDGQIEGIASLIKEFIGTIASRGFSDSGSFYFSENIPEQLDVYTAQVDLESGRTLKQPERIDSAFRGRTATPFWSNDGNSLAYLVVDLLRDLGGGRAQTLRIHSMKTGRNRDIELSFPTRVLTQVPRWSPDDKFIYLAVTSTDTNKQQGLLRVNVATGLSELIFEGPVWAWSPDGSLVILVQSPGGIPNKLTQKDLRTGEEKELIPQQDGLHTGLWNISPDGRWFGYRLLEPSKKAAEQDPARNGIFVIPTAGGQTIRFSVNNGGPEGIVGAYFFWAPPGRGVLFEREIGLLYGLSYLPSFESSELRELDFPGMNRINGLTFHPDGKTIAFHSTEPRRMTEWVMEKFQPPSENK
jgi:Tol biopolymer transport system component